jgi:hypothetical protein
VQESLLTTLDYPELPASIRRSRGRLRRLGSERRVQQVTNSSKPDRLRQIDDLGDQATIEERAGRKRTLLSGPKEFRNLRKKRRQLK